MIVGAYTLDLYCDYPVDSSKDSAHTDAKLGLGDGFASFVDEKGSTARAMARRAGWKLNLETGEALCPRHAR